MKFQQYFRSYTDYFWQWEDGQQVVGIRNGQTIAFTKQIIEMLEALSLQGFPRLGPLLLAIAATNNNGEMALLKLKEHLESHYQEREEISKAFELLYLISSLPKELKQGNKRHVLFQAIFEESHNRLSIKNSETLLRKLKRSHTLPRSFGMPGPVGAGQA